MLRLPGLLGLGRYTGCLVLCAGLSAACGDDGDSAPIASRDSGPDEPRDGSMPPPPTGGRDAGLPIGNPPDELMGERCAVDPDHLFDLVETREPPEIAPLAVDAIGARFGLAFIDDSADCLDAVFVAEVSGGVSAGAPSLFVAVDECAAIDRAAITFNEGQWLVAAIDNRMPPGDLWVQGFREDGGGSAARRISDSALRESEVALVTFDSETAIAAWIDRDVETNESGLKVRVLDGQGEPIVDTVTLESSSDQAFALPSLIRIGELVALGYHRFSADGPREIVLDVLDPETGERVRDPWVLTDNAGPEPSVELAGDEAGGGIVYSVAAGGGRQLWFQQLDHMGKAAPVTSGVMTGGAAEPLRIVNAPLRGIDASIAKTATGFVVAYRALVGGRIDSPRIVVLFLDRAGRIIGDSAVALSSDFGGRTSIETAIDGRVVLGWSDTDDQGMTTVRTVRLPCIGG